MAVANPNFVRYQWGDNARWQQVTTASDVQKLVRRVYEGLSYAGTRRGVGGELGEKLRGQYQRIDASDGRKSAVQLHRTRTSRRSASDGEERLRVR